MKTTSETKRRDGGGGAAAGSDWRQPLLPRDIRDSFLEAGAGTSPSNSRYDINEAEENFIDAKLAALPFGIYPKSGEDLWEADANGGSLVAPVSIAPEAGMAFR